MPILCVLAAAPVAAQRLEPRPNDIARIRTGPPLQQRTGRLLAVSPDSLVVGFRGGGTEIVGWNRVYQLEVSRERRSRLSNMPVGAAVGLAVGLIVITVDVQHQGDGEPWVFRDNRRVVGTAAGLVGGGALLSLAHPGRRRWVQVFRPAKTKSNEVPAGRTR